MQLSLVFKWKCLAIKWLPFYLNVFINDLINITLVLIRLLEKVILLHIQELNEILQQNYSPAENSQNLDEGFNNRISLFGSEKENYNHKQIDLENPENSCLSANHDKIKRAESFQSDEYYHYDDSDD